MALYQAVAEPNLNGSVTNRNWATRFVSSYDTVMWKSALALLCALTATGMGAAQADEGPASPARARRALAEGKIMPLAGLLTILEQRFAGDVMEVELHETKNRWVYEFEMLPTNGRLYRVYVDATTGTVIRTDGPAQERH